MTSLARLMALAGGLVLTVLVILVCVSIIGRELNSFGHGDWLGNTAPGLAAWITGLGIGPVQGDFEIVEAGIAFAIFAFLPITQLSSGHATVDIFTGLLPHRVNRWLQAFWEIVLALVILVIGWRLFVGFTEKLDNGQTTFLLQFPVWWAYGASFAAAIVAALVAVYCASARVLELVTGRAYLPDTSEQGH